MMYMGGLALQSLFLFSPFMLEQVSGCWIGLKYDPGSNQYKWLQPAAVSSTSFRNWRRGMLTSAADTVIYIAIC